MRIQGKSTQHEADEYKFLIGSVLNFPHHAAQPTSSTALFQLDLSRQVRAIQECQLTAHMLVRWNPRFSANFVPYPHLQSQAVQSLYARFASFQHLCSSRHRLRILETVNTQFWRLFLEHSCKHQQIDEPDYSPSNTES